MPKLPENQRKTRNPKENQKKVRYETKANNW